MAEQGKKKSAKSGRNARSCTRYRDRELQTKTAKTRRIFRALKAGQRQIGWKLKEDGKHVFRAR